MHLNRRKEEYSYGLLVALAAAAGFSTSTDRVDIDSSDVTIKDAGDGNGRYKSKSPIIEVQLKCTSDISIIKDKTVNFSLGLKNYNDLRTVYKNPRILVVVLVPENPLHWIRVYEKNMDCRKTVYWTSLEGMPETKNKRSVVVRIPKGQNLTVEKLRELMEYTANSQELV